MPAILAMAYHSLVGSSGPVSSDVLAHRLRRQLGIDAGRAEKQQLLDAVESAAWITLAAIDEIVVDEIGGQRVVGDDAADLGRRQEHGIGRAFANQPATAA